MEKLRKFCVALFGGLSVFFAIVAARNHFFRSSEGEYSRQAAPWGADLERLARNEDKLVFFSVGGEFAPSKAARKELEKRYVFSVLDKTENPADFIVFDYFFRRMSRGGESLACAILTPNMNPIYMSGKLDARKLEKILPAAARSYSENRRLMRAAAERAAKSAAISETEFLREVPLYGAYAGISAAGAKTMPAAVLTENARLDFLMFKKFPAHSARASAAAALRALKARYAAEKSDFAKLLAARAMADIAFAVDADTIAELREAAEAACGKTAPVQTSEAALALAVLSRAYGVFGTEKFIKKAGLLADAAALSAFSRAPVPAKTRLWRSEAAAKGNSIASAYAVAMLANALCDYADAAAKPSYLRAAAALIERLDAEYSHGGAWAVNSANSLSAKFARVRIASDALYPSYIGEGCQAIARIKRALSAESISPLEAQMKAMAHSFIPAALSARASIKLAEAM